MSTEIATENVVIAGEQNAENRSGLSCEELLKETAESVLVGNEQDGLNVANENENQESVEEKVDPQSASNEDEKLASEVNKITICNDSNKKKSSEGSVTIKNLPEYLSYLQEYGEDDEDDNSSDEHSAPRFDSDDEEDSTDEYVPNSDEEEEQDDNGSNNKAGNVIKLKAKGELDMEDLPPVPDLSTLSLSNKDEFQQMGTVDCVLDKLVTIEAMPNMPTYDIDTVLFVDNGQKALGVIFDVMGRVNAPMYVVRFNSIEEIEKLNLQRGTKVYCAPKSKHTQYVFVQELMKIRGSDASWVGDVEVPAGFEDFSDDDTEHQSKRKASNQKRKRNSMERYQQFESNMNKINKINTRLHRMMDTKTSIKQVLLGKSPSSYNSNNSDTSGSQAVNPRTETPTNPSSQNSLPVNILDPLLQVAFDPTIPPPGYPRVGGDGSSVPPQPLRPAPLPYTAAGGGDNPPTPVRSTPFNTQPNRFRGAAGVRISRGPFVPKYCKDNHRLHNPGPSKKN